MRLHEIPGDPALKRGPRRVGRGQGSGHGETCGRGVKGAGARAGSKSRAHFEGGQMPLQRRLPKRGFTNARFKTEHQVVNLSDLNRFDEGAEVTRETLRAIGLARRPLPVKVLAKGTLETKGLRVVANAFSAAYLTPGFAFA